MVAEITAAKPAASAHTNSGAALPSHCISTPHTVGAAMRLTEKTMSASPNIWPTCIGSGGGHKGGHHRQQRGSTSAAGR
eukprot:6564856-Pyramimonas_sp.AAC.1